MKQALKRLPYQFGCLLVFVLAWWAAAEWWVIVLPTPPESVVDVVELLTSSEYYEQLTQTVRRVAIGFAIGFSLALVLGALMGRFWRAEAALEMPMATAVAFPGIFEVMILLVALGVKDSTAIVGVVLLLLPSVTINFWMATKALDRHLDEFAKVFGFSRVQTIRHVILPQLVPAGLASARYGLGHAWKIAIFMEILGLSNGIGYQVNANYQMFNLPGVVKWTAGFMIFILLVEYGALRPVERWATRWRSNRSTTATGTALDDVNSPLAATGVLSGSITEVSSTVLTGSADEVVAVGSAQKGPEV